MNYKNDRGKRKDTKNGDPLDNLNDGRIRRGRKDNALGIGDAGESPESDATQI
jgi:hypothetical protein